MPNHFYTYIYIYQMYMIMFGWLINHCRLFKVKSFLYIYTKYIYDLVWFHGISIILGFLMPNPLYNRYFEYLWFGLFGFYGLSTFVGYLMPNSFLNIYIKYIWFGLVWFGLVWFYRISTIIGNLNQPELVFFFFFFSHS